MAVALAEAGADIVGVSASLEVEGSAVEKEVTALGRSFRGYQCNLSDRSALYSFLESLKRDVPVIDILVNNAGISGFIGPLVDYPVESFDRVMAVNARGVFLGMKHSAPAMADGGSIVNISSISGIGGGANTLAYTASKHAVIGMTKLAAIEFAPRRVRVNAVCPAPTATEMMFELARDKSPDDLEGFRRSFEQNIPLGRYGEADEIAAAIAFFASDQSSFSTGAVLTVDGGMRAR